MTTPYERTRSLIETKQLLQELQDPKLTPRVPATAREIARKLLPHLYAPVPPFSRMSGDPQTVGVIEAATPKKFKK